MKNLTHSPTWNPLASLLPANSPARPTREELALGADGVHSVRVGEEPVVFTALEGTVMVTAEGDWDDHVLWPGQSWTSERPGHHVVAAIRPAKVRIAAA